MRDLFRGYYQPTAEEVEAIWDKGTTVLDANVLLSLYKVLPATSALYLDAIEKRSEKNWLPYQVALEFHKNVHKIRSEQTVGHSKRIKEVEAFRNILRKTENKSRLQDSDLQTQIQGLLDALIDELNKEQSGIKDQTHHHKPDDLLGRISDLFNDKVGQKPSNEELAALHKVGHARFDNETPPGYEDKKTKSGSAEFGDYIFWQQVMDYSKAQQTDIVLVTDDNKADWWLKIDGDSVAPRPELIQEFREFTGRNIIIWPSGKFYSHLMAEARNATNTSEVQAAADDMQKAVTQAQALDRSEAIRTSTDTLSKHATSDEWHPSQGVGGYEFLMSEHEILNSMRNKMQTHKSNSEIHELFLESSLRDWQSFVLKELVDLKGEDSRLTQLIRDNRSEQSNSEDSERVENLKIELKKMLHQRDYIKATTNRLMKRLARGAEVE